ncbi:BolA family protein [Thiomicrorhabdus indica]|uniref:BolA family protein n=1 Tax=Thiomicrorhabdus indica TaxID=2267253 RepID=UPI002AA6601A|nr:BolA/IbaG family iron-sulfur metabolism protein [Thiomicrorhabdus indica]
MSIKGQIESVIQAEFSPLEMQVINESHMHSGPATESHFKLVLVSETFDGLNKVKRQQAVYRALAEIMPQIHALGLHTYTQDEWQSIHQQAPASPKCGGGH